MTHLASKIILIATIHHLRSAEGISFLTQLLYLLVFCLRYLDLFWTFTRDWYNTTLKIVYILTSIYTLHIMLNRFPRSREGEKEWRVSGWILVIAVPTGIIAGWSIYKLNWGSEAARRGFGFHEALWNISLCIEALHLLPQLSLLSHISTPTAINSYYLFALGSYRFLYILNWIERHRKDDYFDPLPTLCAIIQTYIYIEFAWVYWRRQRIKIRAGGVLDHDDWVTGGLLLRWIFGSHHEAVAKGTTGGSWRDWAIGRFGTSRATRSGGRGGISVSSEDDGVGGLLARGPRGGRYNDEEAGDESRETQRLKQGNNMRGEGSSEEGRVLVGEDSDEDEDGDNDTTVWRSSSHDEEGIVLAGSDDEDSNDESRMTTNEIHDRRSGAMV